MGQSAHFSTGEASTESLLTFPCRYEIKVMGRDSVRFDALVQGIVSRHIGRHDMLAAKRRLSRTGKYVSLTCIIRAHSREQLDMIYAALQECGDVLMTL